MRHKNWPHAEANQAPRRWRVDSLADLCTELGNVSVPTVKAHLRRVIRPSTLGQLYDVHDCRAAVELVRPAFIARRERRQSWNQQMAHALAAVDEHWQQVEERDADPARQRAHMIAMELRTLPVAMVEAIIAGRTLDV